MHLIALQTPASVHSILDVEVWWLKPTSMEIYRLLKSIMSGDTHEFYEEKTTAILLSCIKVYEMLPTSKKIYIKEKSEKL